MSTTSRLISGSAAHWTQIGITILSQLAFVPLYLAHWNASTYGIWLAIQALIGIITILDYGFHEYLSYEFLRCGQNRMEISKYLWSGVGISIIINFFQISIILLISYFGILPFLLGELNTLDRNLVQDAGTILLLQGTTWLIYNCILGLIFRALTPLGYYPRMAWWNLYFLLLSNIAPVIAVIFGADFLHAGIVAAIISFILSLPLYFDLFRLLQKEKILFSGLLWTFGYANFISSLAVSGKSLLENLRQQGVRIIISPFVGTVGLTTFSTMRTGANISSQGLNTIIYPLMPELMRFLHSRDQPRSEAAFGTIWFVLVVFLAPAIVLLQICFPPFYHIWTRGKVAFDPKLFATFSITVLIYALAQPALAIVKGNNLLKSQFLISLFACFLVIVGIILLVPILGIFGSGIALIIAEITATMSYIIVAKHWLYKNGLIWPRKTSLIASYSIYIAITSIILIVFLPKATWLIFIISIFFFSINIYKYWKSLPFIATENAKKILNNIPFVKLNISNKL